LYTYLDVVSYPVAYLVAIVDDVVMREGDSLGVTCTRKKVPTIRGTASKLPPRPSTHL
jgi:hypothetical protein